MKLLKLTQWIDKGKTQPVLVNVDLIQSIALAKHDNPVPILGEANTIWLTHVVFKGGTHGFLVVESFEEIQKRLSGYAI